MSSSQLRAGAALTYAGIASTIVLNLLVTPLMLRKLGASGYGLYSAIGAFAGYLGVLDLGLGAAVTRYVAAYRAKGDRDSAARVVGLSLLVQLAMALVAVGVGVLLYRDLGSVFGELAPDELEQAKAMYALLLVNVAASVPLGTFTAAAGAYERFVFLRLTTLARVILRAAVLVALLLLGYGAVAIVVLDTVLNLAIGALTVAYAIRRVGVRVALPRDPALARQVARYSLFILLNVVVDQLYWRVGPVVLGARVGAEPVAVFALALHFVAIFMQVSTAISGVLLPRITTMVVNGVGTGELTAFYARTARIQLMILGCGVLGFTLFGEEFIALWAGEAYRSAWRVAMVMIVPLTIPLFQNVGIEILRAKNLHAFRSVAYLVTALATATVSFTVAPRYGALGVAAATGAALVVGNVVVINVYYHLRAGIDVPSFFRQVSRGLVVALAVAALAGAATSGVPLAGWTGLAVRIALFAAAYAASVWFLGMNAGERELARSFVAKPRARLAT